MWLFIFVFVSGILGAALQHFMPRIHTAQLPMETIYEQIDRVRGQLAEEAARLVEEACSALEGEVSHASELQRADVRQRGHHGRTDGGFRLCRQTSGEHTTYANFLNGEMLPYLERAGAQRMSLSVAGAGRTMFQQLRVLLPPELAFQCGRSGKHLRREAATGSADRLHKTFARLAAGAHSAVLCAAASGSGARGDGPEVLRRRCCDGHEQPRNSPSALTCNISRVRTSFDAGDSGCRSRFR